MKLTKGTLTITIHSRLLAEDLHWFSPHCPQARKIPLHIRSWLSESGSLTARLETVAGDIQVRVLYEGSGRPFASERRCLRLPHDRNLWLREVVLESRHGSLVAARTVAPRETLRGRGAGFGRLGNRPLGALLFSHPAVERGASQWVRLRPESWRLSQGEPPCWGRRTLYHIDAAPLLVSEFFLPPLFHLGPTDDNTLD